MVATIPPPTRNPEIKYSKIFINNEFVNSINNKAYPVYNPCDNEQICEVQEGDKSDIDNAVEACKAAFKHGSSWRRMDASRRGHLLYRLADLIERDIVYMASLETMDTGKPYKHSYQDMVHCVQVLRYYAGWSDKNMGESIPVDGDFFCYTRREPFGVCGLLVPWNYPMLMMTWKMAPALATGNCIIVKPAEQTPLTALYCASLIKEAGFPVGVVNVVPGFKSCVQYFSTHQEIQKISYTGSTEMGMEVMQAAGKSNLKRCTLELSGRCPFVVFEDTDLEFAVQQGHDSAFQNMGQCRWSGSYTYVHEKIYDEFVEKAIEKATARKNGDPYEMDTECGPQIDEEQYKKIMDFIQKCKDEGAQLKCGGNRLADKKGFYIEPTIFSDVKEEMKFFKEEVFGPVQLIVKFKDLDEVIKQCNNTEYGMAASIFTKDINRSMTFSQSLNYGTIWVNSYHHWFPQAPFGGYKKSGMYREMGKYALEQYTQVKNIIYRIPEKSS